MPRKFQDLTPLLSPKSIAIIGASERHGSAGRLVLENLHFLGYTGEIYAVNPKNESVLGHPCYKDLESIGKPVDMVAILLGAKNVLPILQSMKKLGIPAAWALASGFSESGPEGAALQKEIAAYAKENNLLLLGPNCIGILNMFDHSATYSVAINPKIQPGNVSVVMQSGAILMGLANSARFGIRYLISCGNQAALEVSDFIGYLAEDKQTKVIVTFIEGIPDTRKFVDALRAAYKAGKPVLLVKVGRSEAAQRAVQAHTGSLAGSDTVLDAVLNREGAIRVNSLDELVETTELFLGCPLPENDGVGLISLSGGQIGLVSDLSQGLGLNFPPFSEEAIAELRQVLPAFTTISNPLDAWGTGDLEKMYPACAAITAAQENVGIIAMSRDTPIGVAPREIEQSMRIAEVAAEIKEKTGKGVFLFSNFSGSFDPTVESYLREHGIPYLQGTQEAVHALQAFENYATKRRTPAEPVEESPVSSERLAQLKKRFSDNSAPLTEVESRELLAAYGIRGPKEIVASTAGSAVQAANDIGYPVVLKILSPDIQHKTECGGVKVNLKNADEVSAAFSQIFESAKKYNPNALLEGVLVQEMISSDAVEVILGVVHDPNYGPVVVYGSGGILVEILKDSVLSVPPVSKKEAQKMVSQTKGIKLLQGFRGSKKSDVDALANAIVNVSYLARDFADEIAALDINPLMVLPEGKGVCAVDALIERQM